MTSSITRHALQGILVLCHNEPPTNDFDGGHSLGSRIAIMMGVNFWWCNYQANVWFLATNVCHLYHFWLFTNFVNKEFECWKPKTCKYKFFSCIEIATWIENLTIYMTPWQKSQTFKHSQKLEHAMFIEHHEKKFHFSTRKLECAENLSMN